MRVLFLTTVLPGGRRSGGEVVSASIVEALERAGHDVAVVGYQRPGGHGGELSAGVRPIETSSARIRALGWMVRSLAGGRAYSAEKYRSRAYVDTAARVGGADVVVVDHAQMHWALDALELSVPVVFVAHNAERRLYEELATWVNRREARLIGAAEARLAERAAQTWVLARPDAEYFRSLCPEADVRTLEVASPFSDPVEPAAEECDVALLGSWTWKANAAGLEWFLGEVVPLLPAGTRVEVAGPGSERGAVPDARAFLARARVVAVPAVAGGGVQVKALDAIATGIPVVATPVAVRGLGDLPASVAVADAPVDFAAELQRLAALADRDGLRAEAAAWSRARRERFESEVVAWAGELSQSAVAEGARA